MAGLVPATHVLRRLDDARDRHRAPVGGFGRAGTRPYRVITAASFAGSAPPGAWAAYHSAANACHLDLIPYATACKWTELARHQRLSLLTMAGDTLGLLLRDSPVRLLVLNGNSVVEQFQVIGGILLDKQIMHNWSLPRRSQSDVTGFAYRGFVRTLLGVNLRRELLVLGFNHNIQSSFGATTQVSTAVQRWIARCASEVIA